MIGQRAVQRHGLQQQALAIGRLSTLIGTSLKHFAVNNQETRRMTVDVIVEPTKDWPEPDIPDDFVTALRAAPDTADLWNAITPMARWEWVRWINATANADTRSRRIEVAIDKLRAGKRRPCCFDLSSCTDPELARGGKLIGA